MSTYSGYSSSPSVLTWFVGMCVLSVVALVVLPMLVGTAGIGRLATPKSTPNFDEATGINFDDAVAEAKSLITNLKPGQNTTLARSTGGYIRVGYSRTGKLCVNGGNPSDPALDAMAERILAALIVP